MAFMALTLTMTDENYNNRLHCILIQRSKGSDMNIMSPATAPN
jgi:hypothetical protein